MLIMVIVIILSLQLPCRIIIAAGNNINNINNYNCNIHENSYDNINGNIDNQSKVNMIMITASATVMEITKITIVINIIVI